MARMSAGELDEYARALGFSAAAARDAEGKARLIEERRSRTATVRALGLDLEVPVKRMRDKRVADLVRKARDGDDEAAVEAMSLVLGDDQMARVMAAATDEDGTVDANALGVAFARIVTSRELKNF